MTGSIQTDVHLEFTHDEPRNRTILSRRRAGGLCSISKPYWNQELSVLGLQLVNPTAGLFSGDALKMHVTIAPHAQAAITSPSATRFHTMPDGHATITQEFHIKDNAWLDYWPEMIIPQKDSDVTQTTKIYLEDTSTMVFLDSLAPGRLAHGENYLFRKFETLLEIHTNGNLIAKERCTLTPETGRWPLHVPHWEATYYAAIWIAGTQAEQTIQDLQQDQLPEDTLTKHGASLLDPNLGVIRIISPTSIHLKNALDHFRTTIQNQLPLLKMTFRKL
ncbi:MAG: urease accessory protein UreD [Akkermansiaceae bacterium]